MPLGCGLRQRLVQETLHLQKRSCIVLTILNALNLTYLGCTRVFLAEPGHAIAFYGCKGSVRAGLMVKQSTEASKLISSIPVWMGYVDKIKARVIRLQEVNDMIVGLKRLIEKNETSLQRISNSDTRTISSTMSQVPPPQPRITPQLPPLPRIDNVELYTIHDEPMPL